MKTITVAVLPKKMSITFIRDKVIYLPTPFAVLYKLSIN